MGNLAELQATLASLTKEQRLKITKKALRRVGAIVQEAIEKQAPIRPDLPSGTALPIGALKKDVHFKVRVSDDPNTESIVTVFPGKKTEHAADWVENGHVLVRGGYSKADGKGGRRGPGKVIGHVQPHPYIRVAADSVEEKAIDAFLETMADEINRVLEG